jgi:hypothetical protein
MLGWLRPTAVVLGGLYKRPSQWNEGSRRRWRALTSRVLRIERLLLADNAGPRPLRGIPQPRPWNLPSYAARSFSRPRLLF